MANKDFKVKNGIDIQIPLPVSMGGTGQTSTTNTLNSLLPSQASASGKFLTSDGTNASWGTITPQFVPMTANSTSSNITLVSNNIYLVDTAAARTLTLPSSPNSGDQIKIFDASNNALTNNITVQPNGNKMQGSVQNLIIDSNAASVFLIYTGSTYGWMVA